MSEKYSGYGACAIGADLAILNLHLPGGSPARRPRIYELNVGCPETPADAASRFCLQRTTGIGTEGSGLTPIPLDSAAPAAEADFGVGVFSAQPTKTANSEMLVFALNQRASYRWVAGPGSEFIIPATQNHGICLNCDSSTVLTSHVGCILFEE